MKALTLMLACNTEHGQHSGVFHMLTMEDHEGQGVIRLEADEDAAVACVFEEDSRVRLWRRRFRFTDHRRMVGNAYWDSVSVTPATAVRILNYLLDDDEERFSITEAAGDLYDAWERGRITVRDLARAVGA